MEGNRMNSPSDCPVRVYKMMRLCWEQDPEKRPSFGQLRDNHLNEKVAKELKEEDFSSLHVACPVELDVENTYESLDSHSFGGARS